MLFLFLLILQILFISLFTLDQRFFIPFIPMMVIFASQSFLRISSDLISEVKIHWKNRIFFVTIFLFLIFFMVPSTYTIIKSKRSSILDFKNPQFGFVISKKEAEGLNKFLKKELRENQIVWTDLPEILEWEGVRLCGWLPTQIKMVYEIHKKIPVDAILLTNFRTSSIMEEEWNNLLFSGSSLPKYKNVKLYESKTVFAKLLIRDEKE